MTQFELERPLLPLHLYKRSKEEPIFARFGSVKMRRMTFKHFNWPIQMRQRPTQMSKAGFLYTGHHDGVVCFNCGKGLEGWQLNDDPYAEHAKINSNCSYLKSVRTLEFIQQFVPMHAEQQRLSRIDGSNSSINQDTDIEDLQAIHKMPDCVVCLINVRSMAFQPCGHLATCVDCSFQIQTCVICRSKITERIKIYLC